MASVLDWITDGGLNSSVFGGGTPMPGPGSTMGQTDPMGNATGGSMPLPTPAPAPTQPMPPVQMTGESPAPLPQGGDPMAGTGSGNNGGLPFAPGGDPMAGTGSGNNGGLPGQPPVPMPQPRPAIAPGPPGTPPAVNAPNVPPGPPLNIGPGLGLNAQSPSPTMSPIARALGITDKQAQQMASGLGAGLKSVGTNWNKPGAAAFAGSAGEAIEGSQKRSDTQQKQAADYLKASIDSKAKGDEAGYKQNYLRYLAAKLQADTDKAATKEAGANKNDSPTQLYLSAQRLVQPERNALNKQVEQMRKEGADPAAIAKAQADGEAAISAKLNDHFATLGIHPQTAAQIGQQPGNSQQNPLDAGKAGITKDNIAKKLQPGQYYTNPADGKVYQYKGEPKKEGAEKKATPDKPTNPEPANPMNKAEMETGKMTPAAKSGAASDDDDD